MKEEERQVQDWAQTLRVMKSVIAEERSGKNPGEVNRQQHEDPQEDSRESGRQYNNN